MRIIIAPTLLLLAGCPTSGGADSDSTKDPASSGPRSVLLVVDNSGSMREVATDLALTTETLFDGASDLTVGVTSTTVDYTVGGPTDGLDPGEAGSLYGVATDAAALRTLLLCDAIYWSNAELPSDPEYAAAEDGSCPIPETVSDDYLRCECGGKNWSTSEGAGTEEGLEAWLLAVCRAADAPVGACSDYDTFSDADAGTNAALRAGGAAALEVVIISDEGDSSRRVASGNDDAGAYVEQYLALDWPSVGSVMGPYYEAPDGACLDGASTWGVTRYQDAAAQTGGTYVPLTDFDAQRTPRGGDVLWAALRG